MTTTHLPFHILNHSSPVPSPTTKSFTLKPTVPTDIWRKPGPPLITTFNAPLIYKKIPLSRFKRASVTISAAWSTLFDQGGLIFILPGTDSSSPSTIGKVDTKWVKTGIEFYEGEPFVGTVACDRWADWSLVSAGIRDVGGGKKGAKLEIERREGDGTLWVYVVDGEKRVGVREITWPLNEDEAGSKEAWVGVYAARPKEGKDLLVEFEGFELELLS
jgi:regulation of enolase protein 1 (concanavalin A-like superfamily)